MEQTKEILEKQLQILSERSNENGIPVSDVCILTRAMCMVARQLQNQSGDVQGWLASVQLSAKELGVSIAFLNAILMGRSKCSLEHYVGLCKLFDFPFGKFLMLDDGAEQTAE